MFRTLALAAAAASLVALAAADAAAQVVQRPTRPYRGLFGGGPAPDPNRSRTELTFTGSLLTGYDTWLSPSGDGSPTSAPAEQQSGGTVTGEAGVNFYRGRTLRSVSFRGLARTNAYSGINAQATVGASASLSGETSVGRRTQLRGSQELSYDPTLELDVAAVHGPDIESPVPPPIQVSSGYLEQRSWSASWFGNVDQRWTSRQLTMLGIGYAKSMYLDQGHDTSSLSGNATHSWSLSRSVSVRALYTFNDADLQSTEGPSTPMTTQNFGASLGYTRRLSPTRQLQLNASGGRVHVKTLNTEDRTELTYWTPSGGGSVSWDVGRSWSIGGEFNRSATVIPSVTLTSFATNAGSVSISGLISQRIETSMSATYSNGRSGGFDADGGRFENYSGTMQLLFAISRCCATTLNYDYYVYRFEEITDLPSNVPPSFDRHAIRVGLTLNLPLYGTYADGGRLRAARRN